MPSNLFFIPSLSLLTFLIVGLSFNMMACGDDGDNEEEQVEDAGETDSSGENDTTGPTLCEAPCSSHQETTYRLTYIDVTGLSGIGNVLASAMRSDFETERLNVLIDLIEFSTDHGDATFRITGNGGSSATEPGSYTWHPDVSSVEYAAAEIDGFGHFSNTETMSIDFPGVTPGTEPPEIFILPIKDLQIEGILSELDGENLMDATLNGAILLEDAQEVEVRLSATAEPKTLDQILANIDMNYPEEGPDATGWRLTATIIASPVTLVE